jgi:hypothetical protein
MLGAYTTQVLLLVQVIVNQLTINLGFGKHSLDSRILR